MSVRRIVLYAGLTFSLSSLAFSLGSWTAQRSMAQQIADNDARLSALQDNLARSILRTREDAVVPSGTDGQRQPEIVPADGDRAERAGRRDQAAAPERDGADAGAPAARAPRELRRAERGRQLRQDQLRHRRLPRRRLLHHRQARRDRARRSRRRARRRAASCRSRFATRTRICPPRSSTAATRTSRCTRATGRSSSVRGKVDLPALRIDTAYDYDFAEPIFRLGNDYSKGIILSTGYVGQRTAERARHVPDRRASGRVGRRRAEPAGRPGRDSDRPDAGRLPLLVHPAGASRDVPQGSRASSAGVGSATGE